MHAVAAESPSAADPLRYFQPARSAIFCASAVFRPSVAIGSGSALNVPSASSAGFVTCTRRHDRPFVVAVGEVELRLVAREVLEELDRVLAVRRVLQHAGAGDVDVRAVRRLVGQDDAGLRDDLAVLGLGRAHQARVVVGVGERDAALAGGHRLDLVGVAALRACAPCWRPRPFAQASAFASPRCAIIEPTSDRLYGWLPERVQTLPLFFGSASAS